MHQVIVSLLKKFDQLPQNSSVISWSSPIPVFGDFTEATIATVGINPSNREFVCAQGRELEDDLRRFHTLRSLCLESWNEAQIQHAKSIANSCVSYFHRNPYDTWFRRLDSVISGTSHSYYNGGACHVDLIPFATERKWSALKPTEQHALLELCAEDIQEMILRSNVRVLVLNGKTVVENLSALYSVRWTRTSKSSWTLGRSGGSGVIGHSYHAMLTIGKGVNRRQVLVLGFNHNIQSSFGVTSHVVGSIREWITQTCKEHINDTRPQS